MKVDTSKINGYDNMSADEKIAALEAFDMDPGEGFVAKAKLDKATSEAAEYKRQLRERQTEQEKKDAEEAENHKKLQGEHAKLLKEFGVLKLRNELKGQGYSDELADKTATAMYDGDTATMLECQKAFIAGYTKQIEADSLRKMKEPAGGREGDRSVDNTAVELAKSIGKAASQGAKTAADGIAGYIINNK